MFIPGCYLQPGNMVITGKILKSPLRLRGVIAGLSTSLSLSVFAPCLVSSHGLIAGVHEQQQSRFKLWSVASVCYKGCLSALENF